MKSCLVFGERGNCQNFSVFEAANSGSVMDMRSICRLGRAALCSLAFTLVGCASHASVSSPVATHAAMQTPIRAIIYFQQSATDNKPLSLAIADACHCQPIFLRSYSADALIYEIALPQGQTFATFETALMRQADQLKIKLIEQDSVMQHQ